MRKSARWFLLLGGLFNCGMGLIFFNNRLLESFFSLSARLEMALFSRAGFMPFPQNPVHLMLINGFGASVLILGATLIVSAREIRRYIPFIFIDGLGRLVFGSVMVYYVLRFGLMRVILVFAAIELFFAVVYLIITSRFSSDAA